jgi:hypothetical protein
VASVLVQVRIAWGVGGTFLRLNVSETATHVTGHYVNQQCQMRIAILPLYSHALGIHYETHRIWI